MIYLTEEKMEPFNSVKGLNLLTAEKERHTSPVIIAGLVGPRLNTLLPGIPGPLILLFLGLIGYLVV